MIPWYDPSLEEVHFELDRGSRTYEIICLGGLLPRLVKAIETASHDQGRMIKELSAYIQKIGRNEFERFEQEHTDLPSYLRTWCFEFVKHGGTDRITPCPDRSSLNEPSNGIELIEPTVPSFDWTSATVVDPWVGFCSKVELAGEFFNYFPVSDAPFWKDEFCFYLEYLKRISSSTNVAARRAPRLKGLLRDASGRVHGRLEHYVHGPKLHEIKIDRFPLSVRERWACQIRDTVMSLHELDVPWGGYRRSLLEITIDANGDAHIMDIANGVWTLDDDTNAFNLAPFTTKDEDLIALHMLEQFLGVEEASKPKRRRRISIESSPGSHILGLPREIRLLVYESFLCVEGGLAWNIDGFSILRQKGTRTLDNRHTGLVFARWTDPPLLSVCRVIRNEALDLFASCNVFHVECSWIHGFLHRLRECTDSIRRIVLTIEVSRRETLNSVQLHGIEALLHYCRSLTSIGLVLSCQRVELLIKPNWWEKDPLLLKLREFRGLHSVSVSCITAGNLLPFRNEIEQWLQQGMFQIDNRF